MTPLLPAMSVPATATTALAASYPITLALTALGGALVERTTGRAVARWYEVGAALGLLGVVLLAVVSRGAPVQASFASAGPWFALGVYVDALSLVVLMLVALVGWAVVRYARNALDGHPRHGAFMRGVCATLTAVAMLIVAGHVAVLAMAWIATSLCLHRLLVFYPERPAAQAAARKKFVVSRVADVCMIAAGVLLFDAFGTLDLGALLAALRAAHASGVEPSHVGAIAALLACAAALKSAQFPLHGWLPEVMDTPTPVSALLHAGIVNAGGYLLVRFADLMALAPTVSHTLACVALVTAVFGVLAMRVQPTVKGALAYSTVGQMGFMLLECGLGAYAAAVLHLVAHGLYKAYAFLSSGEIAPRRTALSAAHAHRRSVFAWAALLTLLVIGVGTFASVGGLGWRAPPAALALGIVVAIGFAHFAFDTGWPTRGIAIAVAATVGLLFTAQRAMDAWLGAVVPTAFDTSATAWVLSLLVVLVFAALSLGAYAGPTLAQRPAVRALYVHLMNGGYASAWLSRAMGLGPARRHPVSQGVL